MSLTLHLYRNSVFFLALVPLFAIWGFWVTYLLRPPETLTLYDHFHGVVMVGWLVLLIGQAFLIRSGLGQVHRALGKISYGWAPLVVVSTVVLMHYRLVERGLTPIALYMLALQMFLLLQFVVVFALAIRYRHQRDRHARFMVCTALPLLDPIFARILAVNFMPDAEFITGVVQWITFGITDLILLTLVAWDWRENRRTDAFLPLLPMFLATQLPVFIVVGWTGWASFAAWFMALPLS